MARPLSATDDEILQAAQQVLMRRGLNGFSVSEVARELGLSRTAITLRFKSADALKRTLIKRNAKSFEARIASLRVERGAAGLLLIADMIGQMVGGRENFSSFMMRYTANVKDPILLELEEQRGVILRSCVARAMPETAIATEDAVDAFMAHLTGSLLNWQTRTESDAREFLRRRVRNWLALVGIPIEEEQG